MLFALTQVMTRRRIIEPGTTWALSRRTTRRYFLLNPDQARELEQCYWYCLGLCAERFGVLVHAGCLMSTHSHEVVTDVRGLLPRFKAREHRAWQESKRTGIAFAGARRVLRQAHTKRVPGGCGCVMGHGVDRRPSAPGTRTVRTLSAPPRWTLDVEVRPRAGA